MISTVAPGVPSHGRLYSASRSHLLRKTLKEIVERFQRLHVRATPRIQPDGNYELLWAAFNEFANNRFDPFFADCTLAPGTEIIPC